MLLICVHSIKNLHQQWQQQKQKLEDKGARPNLGGLKPSLDKQFFLRDIYGTSALMSDVIAFIFGDNVYGELVLGVEVRHDMSALQRVVVV